MKPSAARAVGYVRVSTEEQVDGHSLDAQRREIERYTTQHGLTLVGIYADEGISAHTDRIEKRPQLCALLGDAARGAFDVVLVHTLDRWARNIRVQSEAFERLGRAGIGFVSLTENFDFTTASGRMMLTVMGGVSEFFSDQLGVHVLKAQRERAESGLPIGPIPFGYVTGPPGQGPVVEPLEAEAVREAFAARAAGQSNGTIAIATNQAGFRTRKGNLFTAHAVKDLLNCRFYTGVVTFRDQVFAGQHEALIPGDLFDRVEARRARRGPHRHIANKPRGLLAGMLKCARCGNALHAERGHQGRPMYRERHAHVCDTNRRSLMAEAVDQQIAEIFQSLELRPDWRSRIAAQARKADGPSMDELRERRGRLARAYADGGYTLAEYEARLAALNGEIRYATASEPVEAHEVAALLGDLPTLWGEATPDERRRLIAPFIERVYLDVESKRISGLVPAPAFRALLDAAMQRTADCSAVLFAPSDLPQAHGILELVETGEN
ncbi:MAG: recombinase family protein [Chloroflexi bacterium]|nr:recombinase family protein [Chloroflexota bacterium]